MPTCGGERAGFVTFCGVSPHHNWERPPRAPPGPDPAEARPDLSRPESAPMLVDVNATARDLVTRLRDESLVLGGQVLADRQLEAEAVFFGVSDEEGWVAAEIGPWTPTQPDEDRRRVLTDFPRRWWWKPRYAADR